ncbi:MaoC family dehydratase N-terminal domain-containing protein [Nocardioides endophyticus]|uniref:MaoC family dehydratase N-terminal domain-containing protein n=1 Tax=Nocardioides endophyticus TaxID=1353775 RepID=A0ABP8YHY8_9ACTN
MSDTTAPPVSFDLIADISPAEIDRVEALEGTPIRVEQWNYEASWDSVRHYAWGLGDDNPLFCDPDYAAATPYGDLLAPPTFPFTAFDGAIGAGLPGVQPIYAGTEWTFHRRLRRGERLVASASFGPIVRKSGRIAPDMVIQSALCRYETADGEVVAESVARTFRVPRRAASTGLAFEARGETVWSDDELTAIRAEAVGEYRRGAAPLTATVGDVVPTVVKGPIGRIDMTAYYAGCPGSPGYKSVEMAQKYRDWAFRSPERLPSNYDPSYFQERVLPSIGHQDAAAAHELGMPGAYNNGPQRVGWFAHCVTNWMGDAAFLSGLDVRLNLPEVFGDVIRIGGTVTSVDGPHISLELTATNQLGETTAAGRAEVLLDDYGRV